MHPRIYTYKITFEEVPYYYYGVHKEKRYSEEYWGSPKTNKWCWELYTPKKQILEFFEYTDEGWLEANLVEKRLIKSVYDTDKWCLNESVGGVISLKLRKEVGKRNFIEKKGVHNLPKEQRIENARKAGKIGGKVTQENNLGIFSLTKEQQRENGKKIYAEGKGIASIPPKQRIENSKKYGVIGGSVSGKNHKKNKTGIFSIEPEQHSKNSKKGGTKTKELGVGIFAATPEQRSKNSKKGGTKTKELGVGIFASTPEQFSERNRKSALQRWQCTETGYISNASGLSAYQNKRCIDTSKRIRLS
jgi:hypothetical protein